MPPKILQTSAQQLSNNYPTHLQKQNRTSTQTCFNNTAKFHLRKIRSLTSGQKPGILSIQYCMFSECASPIFWPLDAGIEHFSPQIRTLREISCLEPAPNV